MVSICNQGLTFDLCVNTLLVKCFGVSKQTSCLPVHSSFAPVDSRTLPRPKYSRFALVAFFSWAVFNRFFDKD